MTIPAYPTWPGRDADLAYLQSILGPDTDAIAQHALLKLPPGFAWQAYMDKCPGEKQFAAACARWKATHRLCKYVAIHGSSTWLSQNYARFAKIVLAAGLQPMAIAGMNSDDMDGKAHRLGEILLRDDCIALGHDLENKGEDEPAPMEWSHAMLYVKTFVPYLRQRPGKAVFSQSWPMPARIHGMGGHWGAFPYEPFAAIQDADAPQFYDEDFIDVFHGQRHAKCLSLFVPSRAMLDQRLAAQQLKRTQWVTIESGDTFQNGNMNGLRDYLSWVNRMPVILWAEWEVSALVRGEIAKLP